MRKLGIFFMGAILSFAFLFCNSNIITAKADEKTVYVGGMPAGFTLKMGGIQIIGLCEVVADTGIISPALQAGLRASDKILKIDGITVDSINQLNEIVHKSGGTTLNLEIEREGEPLTIRISPIKDKLSNRYKIGVLVKDSVSGIGTLTYIDKKSGRFGSLGHSVVGEDKQEMQISNGCVYECTIVGANKGIRGKAGELRGMFLNEKQLGNAEKLCSCGIFGRIDASFDTSSLPNVVADSKNAKPGNAYIYSTVSGVIPKKYEIEIVKVDKSNKENKNYVIKIIDKDLIAETGGIVQGMSGSPILQEGKLIGAVTHVFLNDPTRGFGIDIKTMLQE